MIFDACAAIFLKWLEWSETAALRLAFACCAAHHLGSDPLWLLILAPSGSGKTEMLRAFTGLPFTRDVSSLTPKTLWSGHQSGKGSLVLKLDGKLVLIKELGTILSESDRDARKILGKLREVHDGYFTGDYGTGDEIVWRGRVGLLATGVEAVEDHLHLGSQLGERFVSFRPKLADALATAERSAGNTRLETKMRAELMDAVTQHWALLVSRLTSPAELTPADTSRISRLSTWVAHVRSALPRDHTHEPTMALRPELPGRLARTLSALAIALATIRGRGRLVRDDYALVRRVAIDSAPPGKIEIARQLIREKHPLNAWTLAEEQRLTYSVVQRWADDLWHFRVLTRMGKGQRGDPYLYALSPMTQDILAGTDITDHDFE